MPARSLTFVAGTLCRIPGHNTVLDSQALHVCRLGSVAGDIGIFFGMLGTKTSGECNRKQQLHYQHQQQPHHLVSSSRDGSTSHDSCD